ncbi:MAG TPA: hypothetical protein P5326_07005 [Candidatus Contendobacter sp.]|nr:hypothetical protein [Candidatus Contendobacter sp.]
MFHVNPATPTLRLTATVLLVRQVDHLTLISLAGVRALDLRVESVPERGGHALVAEFAVESETSGHRRVLVTYPTEAEALRQLDRLTRSPGRWSAWLARGTAGLAILFAIWFLFFLPVEGDRLAVPTRNGAGRGEPVAPVTRTPLPRPDRGEWPPPARVDDPAANSVSPARSEAAGRLDR